MADNNASNIATWITVGVLAVVGIIATCNKAGADEIIVSKCYELPCPTGQPKVRGPGRLAYCWQTAPDACAVPLIYMLKVPAGEYATMDVDPVWLRKWLDQYRLDCARYKYRWILKPPPGASKAWSEFGPWCHGLEER